MLNQSAFNKVNNNSGQYGSKGNIQRLKPNLEMNLVSTSSKFFGKMF